LFEKEKCSCSYDAINGNSKEDFGKRIRKKPSIFLGYKARKPIPKEISIIYLLNV